MKFFILNSAGSIPIFGEDVNHFDDVNGFGNSEPKIHSFVYAASTSQKAFFISYEPVTILNSPTGNLVGLALSVESPMITDLLILTAVMIVPSFFAAIRPTCGSPFQRPSMAGRQSDRSYWMTGYYRANCCHNIPWIDVHFATESSSNIGRDYPVFVSGIFVTIAATGPLQHEALDP